MAITQRATDRGTELFLVSKKFSSLRDSARMASYTCGVRVLGIDYGARRIGLALSDATGTLASPWRLLQRPPSEAETSAC